MRWKVLPWLGIAACLLPAADSAATCDAPWSSILVYTGGTTVCEAGVNYQTNWWTQGNAPATKSGPAGSGQPWTVTGTCDACALAPTTPVTFTAFGTSSVSTSLIWTPSSAPASYAVSENGAKVAGVVGSSTTISGLSPNKSHRFSVAALEAAGVSAPTKPFVVTTAARETSGGPAVFAPYIDMGLVSSENSTDDPAQLADQGIHSGLCPEPGRLFRRLAGCSLDYQRHAAERPHDPLARAGAARSGR